MRKLYTLAMVLGLPLILLHLVWRGFRDRAYLRRWGERFGFVPTPGRAGGIVIHAASVGEVNAALPLLRALDQRFPDLPMTVTTFTPTGSARAAAVLPDRAVHAYVPLDLPGAIGRFFDRIEPRLLVIMETEVWPNLYAAAAARDIPLLIANARMSERSEKAYKRWRSLAGAALGSVAHAAAQTPLDAERYVSCGLPPSRVEVAGNLKFDIQVPHSLLEQGQALRGHWGAQRPVLVAGSTHGEDDRTVIGSFGSVLERHPQALLILVPRHPERFESAAQMARGAGLRVEFFSDNEACSPNAQCFVIDAMGELMRFYASGDVAIVGGSFADIGGHNVLEPAALAKPVIVGPHTYHFEDIMEHLLNQGAALRLDNAGEVATQVAMLFGDKGLRDKMGRAGLAVVNQGRGALERNVAAVARLLDTQ